MLNTQWLVTGAAGFIGSNVCAHLARNGAVVVGIDDFSRAGVVQNALWLKNEFDVDVKAVDISNGTKVHRVFQENGEFTAVLHFAGQVSLLASLQDAARDFEVNALGTVNVLEGVRRFQPDTAVVGVSSNKVYGSLDSFPVIEQRLRYEFAAMRDGIDENAPASWLGPYSCSKGVADTYLGEFARSFGLRTASLRLSSVYGPHQHPRSDQGWLAFMLEEYLNEREIQLNGNGKQVRDLLHVDDLARLVVSLPSFLTAGRAEHLNVGGGPTNSASILEVFGLLEQLGSRPCAYRTGDFRPYDQLVYYSNLERVSALTGWAPRISWTSGVSALFEELAA